MKIKNRHLPLKTHNTVYRTIGFSTTGTNLFEL